MKTKKCKLGGNMRILLAFSVLMCTLSLWGVWNENFDSYVEGTGLINVGGIATPQEDYPVGKWELDVSAASDFNSIVTEPGTGQYDLVATETMGEVIFSTESIGIFDFSEVTLRVNLKSTGGPFDDNDYVKVYYQLDGGDEQLFENNGENYGVIPDAHYSEQKYISGSNVRIIIKIKNDIGKAYTIEK